MIFIKNAKLRSKILFLILFLSILCPKNFLNTVEVLNNESNLKLAAFRTELELEYYLVAGSINDDNFGGINIDQDENLIIYGDINVNTNSDIVILEHNLSSINLEILLNSTNSNIWGGENNEFVSTLKIDSLGNIYIAGTTNSFGSGGFDMCLIKYSNTFEYQWNRTWGFTSDEKCWDMIIDSNDNLFLLGVNDTQGSPSAGLMEMYLVKFDQNGNQVWNRTCCNDAFYIAGCYHWDVLSKDLNNNIILAYDTFYSDINYGGRIIKFSNSGDLLFNITHTFPEPGYFWELMIITDENNNIYILGELFYTDFAKGSDFSLLKYNNLGILQWNKTWDYGNKDNSPMDMAFDLEGNIYITGIHRNSGGDIAIVKYDSSGNLLYEKIYGNTDPSIKEEAYGIAFDSKNNVYIAGVSDDTELGDDNMLLITYNPQGELLGSYSWGFNNTEKAYDIEINSNDEIIIGGTTNSFTNDKDLYLAKLKVEFETIAIGGFDFISLIVGISIAAVAIIGGFIGAKVKRKKRKS